MDLIDKKVVAVFDSLSCVSVRQASFVDLVS